MIDLRHGDCLEVMRKMEAESIDLTVTSPPYDEIRTYDDTLEWGEHVWRPIISELFRVTKDGGVVVWVVGDSVVDGSETGTSFKQALYFMEVGFKLHDTMIYRKLNYVPLTHRRYEQAFEYMYAFSRGAPSTFNPKMEPCKHAGSVEKYGPERRQNHGAGHSMRLYEETEYKKTKDYKIAPNVFEYIIGRERSGHPAAFPERLAYDQITTWSNEGDTVLDPFLGSGTTMKMCAFARRNGIGIEKVRSYFKLAEKRIRKASGGLLY